MGSKESAEDPILDISSEPEFNNGKLRFILILKMIW